MFSKRRNIVAHSNSILENNQTSGPKKDKLLIVDNRFVN